MYKGRLTINFYNDEPLILLVDPDEVFKNLMRDTKENEDLIVELKRGDKAVVSKFKAKDIRSIHLKVRDKE